MRTLIDIHTENSSFERGRNGSYGEHRPTEQNESPGQHRPTEQNGPPGQHRPTEQNESPGQHRPTEQNRSSRQHRPFFRTLMICVTAISLALPGPAVASGKEKPRPVRVLMVGGGESHNFDKWYRDADAATLRRDGLATVVYTDNTDSIIYYLPKTDVLFLCNNQPIRDPATRQAIFNFVRKGKGLVLAHAALWYNWKDWPEYNLRLAGGGSRGHDAYGAFQVTVTNRSHPVMEGLPASLTLSDERYYYVPDPASPGLEILATASAEGADKTFPSIFVVKDPKARIVGIALGHDGASHDLPEYQTLLRNAVKWVSKRK